MNLDEKFPFTEFETVFLEQNPYILTGLRFGKAKLLLLEQTGVKQGEKGLKIQITYIFTELFLKVLAKNEAGERGKG